jgi:hypothetical protein
LRNADLRSAALVSNHLSDVRFGTGRGLSGQSAFNPQAESALRNQLASCLFGAAEAFLEEGHPHWMFITLAAPGQRPAGTELKKSRKDSAAAAPHAPRANATVSLGKALLRL